MKTEVFNNVRFVHKGDTEQNWNLATGFIPLDKELIIYKADENNPFPRIKIGDGVTPVQDLPWANNSIFGKELGKTKEVFKEIWSQGVVADIYLESAQVYITKETYEDRVAYSTDAPVKAGKTYTLCIESFKNNEKMYVNSLCKDTTNFFGNPALSLFYNIEYSDETGINIIGPNALCITFIVSPYYNGHQLLIYSTEKFIGTVSIGNMEIVPLYETIPNNSFITDKNLLLKDGKLNTTFGKPIIGNTEKKQVVYDFYTYHSGLKLLEELNIYESSYNHSFEGDVDLISEIIDGQIPTSMTLEIRSYEDKNQDTITTFNYDNAKVMYGDSYHEAEPVIIVNSNQTKDEILTSGFAKIDNSKPAFMISLFYESGDHRVYKIYLSERIGNNGEYTMYFFKQVNEIDYIKLPLEALPIDKIRVSYFSDRIPTSYAVQYLIEEMGDKLYDDIYDMINSRLTIDYTPTEHSYNLITSGAVFNSVKEIKESIDEANNSVNKVENLVNNLQRNNQLIEGIVDARNTATLNSKTLGLSANRNAVPTAAGAWIEGNAASLYNIDIQNKLNSAFITVSKHTSGKTSYYEASIMLNYNNANEARIDIEKFKSNDYMSIVFEDEPDARYYLKKVGASYPSEDQLNGSPYYGISLEFAFIDGQGSFPIDETAARSIQYMDLYPSLGAYSHSEGDGTVAYGKASHVEGQYNIIDINSTYAHIIGNGTDDNNRSNAHTVDWDGNAWYAGQVTSKDVNIDMNNVFYCIMDTMVHINASYGTYATLSEPLIVGQLYRVVIDSTTYTYQAKEYISVQSGGYDLPLVYLGNLSMSETMQGSEPIPVTSDPFCIRCDTSNGAINTHLYYQKENVTGTAYIKLYKYYSNASSLGIGSYINDLEKRIENLERKIFTFKG